MHTLLLLRSSVSHFFLGAGVLLPFLVLAACAGPPRPGSGKSATLSGTVTYLPRIALPPNAVVHVRLEDVSLADRSATMLAEQTIRTDGRQVPIPFKLNYDPERIEPRHRYAVRAEIRDAHGDLLWITDTMSPVLTNGAPSDGVEVRVVQVASGPAGSGGTGASDAGGMLPQETDRDHAYRCQSSDGPFSFRIRTRPGEIALWLPERFGSRYLVLPNVRSASGAKYQDGDVAVWTKGLDMALFEIDGHTFTDCTRDPQRSAWEDARRRGVDVRAVGQEPGWHLEITEGERIRFVYAYGEREAITPAPESEMRGAQVIYHAQTEAHDLMVTIADEPCSDAMSGERFDKTVTIELDGETYRGCGRVLH